MGRSPRRGRIQADHQRVADQCRERPGRWFVLGEYSPSSIYNLRALVERGVDPKDREGGPVWSPVGAFEMRTSLTEFYVQVEVRLCPDSEERDLEAGS